MNESGTFERLTERSLEEHRQIHFFLDQLQKALRGIGPERTELEPMRRVAAELEGLIERLSEHFEREEEGGLFRALVDADEATAPDVRRLEDQHARLIEILEMARIHAERGDTVDAGPLKEDVEGFLEVLRAHEKAEEALFRRALSV
ncbi:MAG: hemerythrin domain-containing protein [Acidobacteriia bacterium]|nr:hemerythrin domain-containing protein [Terriglobia bacterium]